MGLNDPIDGVGVGLGKKPAPGSMAAPGTSVLHFPAHNLGALMQLHGQFLDTMVANFPADPREQASATIHTPYLVKRGWSQVTLRNVRILSLKLVPGGAVEATVRHSGSTASYPTPSCYAAYTSSKSGIKTLTGAEAQYMAVSTQPGTASRVVSTKGISGI